MNLNAPFTNQRSHTYHQLMSQRQTVKAKRILTSLIAVMLFAAASVSVYGQRAESVGVDRKGDKTNDIQPPTGEFDLQSQKGILKGTFIGKAIADGPLPYVFTQTFHEDGTCESNASIDLIPPAASTARGQWQFLGGDQFASTTVGTLINSVLDPTLFGTFKIRQLLTLNHQRDQMVSQRVQVDIFDVDGNPIFSFGAVSDGPARLVTVEVLH